MALPFILAGAAAVAAGYGAKKSYDGYKDKSRADKIIKMSQEEYEEAKKRFDLENEQTTQQLESLGQLQLQVGSDFAEFRIIADKLLTQLERNGEQRDLALSLPKQQLAKIKRFAFSAVGYMGQMAGAGVAGGAAAYAVYGGVMALGAASTGTSIASLSGVAAYNATMAAIGGGSLAAGGLGMAGGAMILGSVVAAPIIAIAGLSYSKYAEKALAHAEETMYEVDAAISKMRIAETHFQDTRNYVGQLLEHTKRIYAVFQHYFQDLKYMDAYLQSGGDIHAKEDEAILAISNGYQVAAILTDIITTPLFKPKTNESGEVVLNADNEVEMELDDGGFQVLNNEKLNVVLQEADQSIQAYIV